MRWIYKAEKKFGKYAIPDLMKYVMGLTVLGGFLGLVNPQLYYKYLILDIGAVMHGQVWRLVTFVLYPRISANNLMVDMLFLAIIVYLYFSIGRSLERTWGTFRFNLFVFSGVLLTILATILYYLATGSSFYLSNSGITYANLEQVFRSVILAFAFLFPNAQFLIYFVIPVKAKWLGYVYIGFSVIIAAGDFANGNYLAVMLFVVAFLNFVVFYFIGRGPMPGVSFNGVKNKKKTIRYKNTAPSQHKEGQPRHRCSVCGITDQDAPEMEFRYCSKCEGNYEYCSDHLFTHEHVHHN